MELDTRTTAVFAEISRIMGDAAIYLVGGSVRDILRGVESKDYDFATPLLPDDIEARIKSAGRRAYLVGKRYGTVGFTVGGEVVEVTTFRAEHYQPGNRKPEVKFVAELAADLSRRDFTINAIALRVDKRKGIIDPFEGRADLESEVIRAVGKPKDRFKEDPLRMLRAARFAAQMGYTIDENTFLQMGKMAPSILNISKERWTQEIDKLLVAPYCELGLRSLMDAKLLNFVIPELSLQSGYDQNSCYHSLELWEHTVRVVANAPCDVDVRWAALLHDIAKPFTRRDRADRSNYIDHEALGADMAERIGRHLKWSNQRVEIVCNLIANHLDEDSPLKAADDKAKMNTDP